MVKLTCPICGGPINIPDDALPGEIYEHDCGAMLEVVNNNGTVSLKLLENVGEDWGE
jgi:alpha-aminoadipate carrier protein LysW